MGPRSATSLPLAPPSFYRHVGFPEWGVGIALFRDAEQEEITVLFEAAGLRTVSLSKRVLVALPIDRLDEALRGKLLGMAKGRQEAPRTLPAAGPRAVPALWMKRRPKAPPPEPPPRPAPLPPAKVTDDGSDDVMDRRRRIPGSYETGKRR